MKNPEINTMIGLGLFIINDQFEIPSEISKKILAESAIIVVFLDVIYWLKNLMFKSLN